MAQTDPRTVHRPQQLDIPCGSGLFSNPSRFQAPLGSLSNVRNFEVVDGIYEESQGLTIVGPSLDRGPLRFWHADIVSGDTTISGTWNIGDYLYWYADDGFTVAGSARIYYVDMSGSNRILTIVEVSGRTPRRSTKFYTSSGATLVVSGNSAQDDVFIYQTKLALSWADFEGPKFLGSLVSAQAETSSVWDSFKPDPLGVGGISGVFQLKDSIYAVRDFFGGRFVSGSAEPAFGDEISVNNGAIAGTFTAKVAGYKLLSGSWEDGDAEGYLYLAPSATTSLDMADTENWTGSTTITNTTKGTTLGITVAGGERNFQNKGLLWKKDAASLQGGWKYIDLGYSIAFDNGLIAPQAEEAPLIYTDALSSVTDTGLLNLDSPATEYPSTGTYSAWTGLSNMQAGSPGSYASTSIQPNDYSRVLELNLLVGSTDPAAAAPVIESSAKILGVEITVLAHQTVGTDAYIKTICIRNDTTGAEQYLSTNYAGKQPINTDTATLYTFGGQLDTWGLDSIDVETLNSGNYTLLLQFGNSNGSTVRTVNVDQVALKVHYSVTSQHLYFYNGTSDVSTGKLFSVQVMDGEWSTDNASGWMTVRELSSPGAVFPGHQIRSAPSGGGDLIATVRNVQANLLPSLEELDTAKTIYQYRTGTFSGNENTEAAFVVTGASPAFLINQDDEFAFIRTPVDTALDKPKHVEIHRGHLVLAIGSHLLVSSVGSPTNFNTYDGATTWSLKDQVTGLASSAQGTTMVACADSIHYLQGSGATGQDAFAVRLITDNGGALPYTINSLLGNIFVDTVGITTADVSDKFGGFDVGRRSNHLRNEIQEQLRKVLNSDVAGRHVIGAIPVRNKNQYRVYLSDGTIITATYPLDPQQPLAFTMQHYGAYYEDDSRGFDRTFAPTALSSEVLSNGEESIIIGTRLGHVMRVDPNYMEILSYASREITGPERKSSLSTWAPFKFMDFNPLHANDATQSVKFTSMDIYVEHQGYSEINRVIKTDYSRFLPAPDANNLLNDIGLTTILNYPGGYPGTQVDDYFTWYVDTLTDGLCIRLSKFGGHGSTPLRIVKLTADVSVRAKKVDRIHETRAVTLVNTAPAFDLNVSGATEAIGISTNPAVIPPWDWSFLFTLDSINYTHDGNYTVAP